MNSAQRVKEYLTGLQQRIVDCLEDVDGKFFRRDLWERPEGGGGLSCVLEEGNVLERGGVELFARVRRWAACLRHRRPARIIGALVRGHGRIARAASTQSLCPYGASERALSGSAQGRRRAGLVVWRRHGLDPILWF